MIYVDTKERGQGRWQQNENKEIWRNMLAGLLYGNLTIIGLVMCYNL